MKLAFCLNKYFPFGGLQADFLAIARLCWQRGHEVVVYTLAWQGEMPEGLEVHLIPVRALTNHGKNMEFARQIQPLLQAGGFDGVIGFMKIPSLDIYYAADTCFQTKAQQDHGWLYRLSPRYRNLVALEKAVFDPASHTQILMLVETEIAPYIACYHTPRERFHLLPPGTQRECMAPANAAEIRAALRREFAIATDDKLLLMVGSDFKRKGLDRILTALATLPPRWREKTWLLVLGQAKAGPFQRLARRLGVSERVRFMAGRHDVSRFLLGADLLLHPAYTEMAGNVLLEAIIAGLPVLTTANCGYAFHVERAKAGRVVPVPFVQERFNASLLEMLESPDWAAWSQNGITYGRTEDLYSRPEAMLELITSLLQQRPRS
jgi:UDP-glucose:(heptosyl)LPS alpha-1,3-glucosyltransferase